MKVSDAPREFTSKIYRGRFDYIQCADGRVKYMLKKKLPGDVYIYIKIFKKRSK